MLQDSLRLYIEVVVSSGQIIFPDEGLDLRKFDLLRSKLSGTIKTRQLANLRGISVFNRNLTNLLRLDETRGEERRGEADVDMGPANLANLNCFVLELCQSEVLCRTQSCLNQTIELNYFNNLEFTEGKLAHSNIGILQPR